MKVCILTSSYPRFEGDYAGIFVAGLARALSGRGAEIVVLAPRGPGLPACEVSGEVRILRFPYFWPRRWEVLAYGLGVPSNLKRNPLLYLMLPFFLLGEARALGRLLRKEKIPVVNAHWMVMQGLVAAWFSRGSRVRLVLTIHGGDLNALAARYRFGHILANWIVRSADHVFCVSSPLKFLLESLLRRDTSAEVLPMGISLRQFDASRRPVEAARVRFGIGEEKVVLFLGRLQEVKGVRTLIEAADILKGLSTETVSVVIAGDGLERKSLERLTVERELGERVRFLGAVPHQEVPALLAVAHVVCLPSTVERSGITEGLGMVLIEAMAMGKVVVASRAGGISDLIQDGINGFLTEPEDPRMLAEKLAQVLALGHEAEPVRRAARRTAEQFSCDHVAGRYAQVFEGLAGSVGRA